MFNVSTLCASFDWIQTMTGITLKLIFDFNVWAKNYPVREFGNASVDDFWYLGFGLINVGLHGTCAVDQEHLF